MRQALGVGTPRGLQARFRRLFASVLDRWTCLRPLITFLSVSQHSRPLGSSVTTAPTSRPGDSARTGFHHGQLASNIRSWDGFNGKK